MNCIFSHNYLMKNVIRNKASNKNITNAIAAILYQNNGEVVRALCDFLYGIIA